MSDELLDKVLGYLVHARQYWDENPPPPPSPEAAALARRYIRVK